MTPEGREKRKIVQHLKKLGAWYCTPFMAGMGRAGVPDILTCIRGLFVGIEVKRPGGKTTLLQRVCGHDIKTAGGVWIYGDAETVIECLERHWPWQSKKS